MNNCRYCDQPILDKPVTVRSYWQGFAFESHQLCAESGRKAEALECQTVDADCNDCKHFQRGERIRHGIGSAQRGHCLKFDKETTAFPNKWTGHVCFEHRRS